ncbi:MAG: YheT family hydrolase [Gemmatimonadota bacterium]
MDVEHESAVSGRVRETSLRGPGAPAGRREATNRPGRTPLPFRRQPFQAAWWVPGPHGQTLAARWLRRRLRFSFRRERIETPDGDFLDLDEAAPAPTRALGRSDGHEAAPMALLLHGLEGCSGSGYVLATCAALAERGIRAVAMNFRSRSGEPNRRPDSYHAGRTDDLAFVLGRLAARRPGAPLGAIGFSLGGNVLLKYLGQTGDDAPEELRAAVAISVPFDLSSSARALERGLGRLYGSYFLRSLKRGVRAKATLFPQALDSRRASAARTLREFDDAVTAPVHGFRSAADYYARASCAADIGAIRVPTLLLQSSDDPLVPWGSWPEAAVRENPWLVDGRTAKGGHVGFVSGTLPWRPVFWAEREASRFLAAHLPAGP